VLEVSVHSQGACIEASKRAVLCWATLVKDDSGPADVVGLAHMCVLQKGFWKGRKCVLKIMVGSGPVAVDVADCKVLHVQMALHALALALSEGESFTSQSSLVCFVRQMGSDEAGVADHNLGLVNNFSKKDHQHIECILQPLMISRSNKAIICTEGHWKVPHSSSCKSICGCVMVASDGKLKPAPHHLVHDDVEESGGEESTLSGASSCSK